VIAGLGYSIKARLNIRENRADKKNYFYNIAFLNKPSIYLLVLSFQRPCF
jgi:hypothetical protein